MGNILSGRKVALKTAQNGFLYPLRKAAPHPLKGADILYANLESLLSDH